MSSRYIRPSGRREERKIAFIILAATLLTQPRAAPLLRCGKAKSKGRLVLLLPSVLSLYVCKNGPSIRTGSGRATRQLHWSHTTRPAGDKFTHTLNGNWTQRGGLQKKLELQKKVAAAYLKRNYAIDKPAFWRYWGGDRDAFFAREIEECHGIVNS